MIDPAVIAVVAASSAIRKQQGGPVTLSGLLFSFVAVFGLAGLIVCVIGALVRY
jgi:hypothetical protein